MWNFLYIWVSKLAIHSMSAIDIALWDIASQCYQVPIHILLGGKYRDKIRAYGTFIPADTPEESAKIAADMEKQGFTRCGGISEMRKIYDLSQLHGTKLIPHGFSTGILLSATVQFLAATERCDLMEYSQSNSPLFRKLVKNLIPFENGYVKVPDCIGLGVELDEELLEKYRMK